MNRMSMLTLATMVAAAVPAAAQGGGRGNGGVPPGQRPPAGMCRVWIEGVPPGRQPAPTDCATAAATRPANARIIYGDRSTNGRGIDDRSGRIIGVNGQRCVQRTDREGRVRTFCDDRDDRRDDDRLRAMRTIDSNGDVRLDQDKHKAKTKGKGKGHGRDDENR